MVRIAPAASKDRRSREPAARLAPLELRVDALSRARWERLTRAAPLQQQWSYGAAMAALGAEVTRLVLRDAATRRDVALAQFVLRRWLGRRRIALASRGPVWLGESAPETRAAALETLRGAVAAQLAWPRLAILAPDATADDAPARAAGLSRVFTGAALATLDLGDGSAAARARMKVKWRNRLAAAERAGLVAALAAPLPGGYDWLLERDGAQQAARGYVALPPTFTSAFHAAGGLGSVRLALAHSARTAASEPLAAMLFLRHGDGATYHIGWSGDAGRAAGAHNLLLWRAIEAFAAEGVRWIDLGGIDTTRRGAGLARFKLGAGATARQLAGAYA